MLAKSYSFQESVDYLLSLGNEVSAMKLGLENIRTLLAAFGDPQNRYLKVQVAGTNGKGSVCAFLNSICLKAGIKTGLYTSPHLISITERIKIAGQEITEEEFARFATTVRGTVEDLVANGELEYTATFFEQVTAITLLAFAEAKVELAILETGLGGRLDATTAANAEIAAITRIDYDHQQYLGETIEEIAAEKAAIITAETRYVVLGEQSRDVMRLLRKHCCDLGIEPLNDEYEPWRLLPDKDGTVKVILSLLSFPPIRLGLKGRHQIENAQTAIQITKALLYHGTFLDTDGEVEVHIVEGLKNARHPGRLEYCGRYLFDGAHNPGGAKALAAYLDEFETRRITLVFGAMKDKPIAEIANILFPSAYKIILTQTENSRAMTADEIAPFIPVTVDPSNIFLTATVERALAKADDVTGENGLILVTGSLYLVGEAKKILNN